MGTERRQCALRKRLEGLFNLVGERVLVDGMEGDLEGQGHDIRGGKREAPSIEQEEDIGGAKPDAFVSIQEGMVLDEVSPVDSGHLAEGGVQVLAPERLLGGHDGALQQPFITHTMMAAVLVNHLAMQDPDLIHRHKPDGRGHREANSR